MTRSHRKGGFMLVTVLFIAAVGLLFGAGALLLFRFQCQMRIDRQHELEKVYAVRSALNYIRRCTSEPADGKFVFRHPTGSGRDLGVIVSPVQRIFPNPGNPKHLDIGDEGGHGRYFTTLASGSDQYNLQLDYEYGATVMTNLSSVITNTNRDATFKGLAFVDLNATNNVKWWVNIGMQDTGGWLQEDYGRRYFFHPYSYVPGFSVCDIMRLCIIRNVTNEGERVGCTRGWPLSQEGERALALEIAPRIGDKAQVTLSEYAFTGGSVLATPLICATNWPTENYMGLQVAQNRVSIFYISNKASNDGDDALSGYVFSDTGELTIRTYDYFAKEVQVGNALYGGVITNDYGQIEAPELRAVFEVEAAADSRGKGTSPDSKSEDFLTNFRVTPAYQYDVYIEHPQFVTNRATVAQRINSYSRNSSEATSTVLTYDTHGTENKGFRRDERELERTRSGGRR